MRLKALDHVRSWPTDELLHINHYWSQSADRLASTALQLEKGMVMITDQERHDLKAINRLDKILEPAANNQVIQMAEVRSQPYGGVMHSPLYKKT